jgi:hypothetical protein
MTSIVGLSILAGVVIVVALLILFEDTLVEVIEGWTSDLNVRRPVYSLYFPESNTTLHGCIGAGRNYCGPHFLCGNQTLECVNNVVVTPEK